MASFFQDTRSVVPYSVVEYVTDINDNTYTVVLKTGKKLKLDAHVGLNPVGDYAHYLNKKDK